MGLKKINISTWLPIAMVLLAAVSLTITSFFSYHDTREVLLKDAELRLLVSEIIASGGSIASRVSTPCTPSSASVVVILAAFKVRAIMSRIVLLSSTAKIERLIARLLAE